MKYMSTAFIIGILILGVVAGVMSSLVGIGGGLIIVPVLVLVFGLNQKEAQGTSLLMLSLPVAFIGAYNYYKKKVKLSGRIIHKYPRGDPEFFQPLNW